MYENEFSPYKYRVPRNSKPFHLPKLRITRRETEENEWYGSKYSQKSFVTLRNDLG